LNLKKDLSLNKFIISNKQNINDNLVEKLINDHEIHKKELDDNKIIQPKDDIQNNDKDVQICNTTILGEEVKEIFFKKKKKILKKI
jgi:hypothetical protein